MKDVLGNHRIEKKCLFKLVFLIKILSLKLFLIFLNLNHFFKSLYLYILFFFFKFQTQIYLRKQLFFIFITV